jgi:hypothetical protein
VTTTYTPPTTPASLHCAAVNPRPDSLRSAWHAPQGFSASDHANPAHGVALCLGGSRPRLLPRRVRLVLPRTHRRPSALLHRGRQQHALALSIPRWQVLYCVLRRLADEWGLHLRTWRGRRS